MKLVTKLLGKNSYVQELLGEIFAYMVAYFLGFKKANLPKFPTVHDGHHQVEQDDAGGALLLPEHFEGLQSVARAKRAIPFAFEDGAHALADVVVVLHN